MVTLSDWFPFHAIGFIVGVVIYGYVYLMLLWAMLERWNEPGERTVGQYIERGIGVFFGLISLFSAGIVGSCIASGNMKTLAMWLPVGVFIIGFFSIIMFINSFMVSLTITKPKRKR